MAATKLEGFSNDQIRLAEIFKALAHPARVAILEHLIKKQTCVCGDLVEELPLAQATVSQHLKVLKNAGLIKGETEGVYSCYCADGESCCAAMGVIMRFVQCLPGCC